MSSISKTIIPSLGEHIGRGMIRRIFFANDVHVIRAGPLPLVRQLLSPDDVGVQYALWGPVSPFSEFTAVFYLSPSSCGGKQTTATVRVPNAVG